MIAGLTWDDEVSCAAADGSGDNWPITWVEDDLCITAWGDGPGFDGPTSRDARLSLGFARIYGDPPEVRGEDFATNVDTPEGGGSSGIKASGLLMVDGVLYMFVRNYKPPGSDDFTNADPGVVPRPRQELAVGGLAFRRHLRLPGVRAVRQELRGCTGQLRVRRVAGE